MNSNAKSENTTILDLPQEMISPIFGFLPEGERQRVRLVCKSWRNIYDEFHKIKIEVDNVNWICLNTSQFVSHAIFTNWTRDYILQNPNFPLHLTTLQIINTSIATTFYNLFPLLESCINLKSLIVGNLVETHPANAIPDHKLQDWVERASKWYPNLEHFKYVDVWPTTRAGLVDFSKSCCRPKSDLLTFFFQSFQNTRLKHFEVARENSFWMLPIRMFFYSNIASLEEEYRQMHLFVIPVSALGQDGLSQLLKTTYHSGLSTVEWEYHPDVNPSIAGGKTVRQLAKFVKKIRTEKNRTPRFSSALDKLFAHPVFEILMYQRNMKEFTYESWLDDEVILSKLSKVLGNNRDTLEKLDIISRYCPSGPQLLDFIDLSCLIRLRYLSLNIKTTEHVDLPPGYLHGYDEDEQEILPEVMYDVSLSFPKTLYRLELHCPFYIDQINWLRIFQRLENLQHLKLFAGCAATPWFQSRGSKVFILNLDDITAIVNASRKLRRFELFWPKPKEKLTLHSLDCRAFLEKKIFEIKSIVTDEWKLKIEGKESYTYRSFDVGFLDYFTLKIHITRK